MKWGTGKIKPFKHGYDAVPGGDQDALRNEILKKTGWSYSLFIHTKNGIRAMSKYHVKDVENIFKKYGIDAWTGQPIKQSA